MTLKLVALAVTGRGRWRYSRNTLCHGGPWKKRGKATKKKKKRFRRPAVTVTPSRSTRKSTAVTGKVCVGEEEDVADDRSARKFLGVIEPPNREKKKEINKNL